MQPPMKPSMPALTPIHEALAAKFGRYGIVSATRIDDQVRIDVKVEGEPFGVFSSVTEALRDIERRSSL